MAGMIRGFFRARIKKERENNCLPHSAAVIIFLLAPCHHCAPVLPFRECSCFITATMGKRGSFAAGATSTAAKKAKTSTKAADADAPTMGNWVQTKFLEKDLQNAAKIGILKDDPAEVCIAGPEIIPRPPARFRVLFLAFLLRGFSFPLHPFLRGLLFAYRIQLHDLNPNTILHIACFIMLCECFLGIEPHWALWRRIFVVRHPLNYQTSGFSCTVHPKVEYFKLQRPENNPGWRTRWFYAKDQPAAGQEFRLEEFHPTNALQPMASWVHELNEEEMVITEPLMEKIRQL
jgi:hypothetical protein